MRDISGTQDRATKDGACGGAADILIPVRNGYACTRTLLEGIYRHTDFPYHIYILDNASTDETVDLPKIYTRDITVVRNRANRGWAAAVNQGIQMGANPYLVFLGNDVELAHGWLGNMVGFLNTHPRIAAVGPLISGRQIWQCVDRVREDAVPSMPRFFTEDIHERNRILQYHFHRTGILTDRALGFCCVVLRRRAVSETGPLAGSPGACEADFCARLRKNGYVLGLALDTCVARLAVEAPAGAGHDRRAARGKPVLQNQQP